MSLSDVLRMQSDLSIHSSMTWKDFDTHDISEIRHEYGLLVQHLEEKEKRDAEKEQRRHDELNQLVQALIGR